MLAAAGLLAIIAPVRAPAEPPPTPDVLVYNNGDRVHGRLLTREGDIWVFRSLRFGDLRVAESEARVITASAPADAAVVKGVSREGAAAPADSPERLASYLRHFLGPWKGKFVFSSQITQDDGRRADVMTEASMKRSWPKDNVEITARYDYNKTNEVDTADTFRGSGLWRHTLPRRLFTVYGPSYEWNRASTIDGVSSDYIVLQQEVGVGVKAVDREDWKVRVGVAENFFNNWNLTTQEERAARVESVFLEADLKLPWRILVTERAVYYYAFATGGDGWEHQLEISKKLTNTLSLGLRHEVRYNDPDVRTEDYSMLRLLLGFDF